MFRAQPYIISPMAAALASFVSFVGKPNFLCIRSAMGIMPFHFKFGAYSIVPVYTLPLGAPMPMPLKFCTPPALSIIGNNLAYKSSINSSTTSCSLVGMRSCSMISPLLFTIPNLVVVPPISIPTVNSFFILIYLFGLTRKYLLLPNHILNALHRCPTYQNQYPVISI